MVGFLQLIKERAKWMDYDPAITEYQVRSIRKASKGKIKFRKKQFQDDEANASSFSSLKRDGRWKEMKNGAGIPVEWIIIE